MIIMKKKILFINNSLYGGGAEKILQTLLNNLDYNRYEITLYSLFKENISTNYPLNIHYKYIYHQFKTDDSFLYKLSVRLRNIFISFIYKYLSPKVFYYLFIRGKYDTEIAFIEGYATRIISGSTNKKSTKIAWVHIDLKENHWTSIAYKNYQEEVNCYQKFNHIICVSNSVLKSFKELFPSTNTAKVKYNPINDTEIRLLAAQKIEHTQKSENKIRLISIGRLVSQKGYDRLFSIIYQLKKEGYNLSINILGDGPDKELLENYVKDKKLNETINLMGFCNNPYPYLKNADLFVCSSRSEGYSTVITEALILGTPIITTNCAGMNELLGNGEYGLITENNENSLYKGLKFLLDNPHIIKRYKIKATERGNNFRLKHLINEIDILLSE